MAATRDTSPVLHTTENDVVATLGPQKTSELGSPIHRLSHALLPPSSVDILANYYPPKKRPCRKQVSQREQIKPPENIASSSLTPTHYDDFWSTLVSDKPSSSALKAIASSTRPISQLIDERKIQYSNSNLPADSGASFGPTAYDSFFTSTPLHPPELWPGFANTSNISPFYSPEEPIFPAYMCRSSSLPGTNTFNKFDFDDSSTLFNDTSPSLQTRTPLCPQSFETPKLPHGSQVIQIAAVLEILRDARISPTDVLLEVLDPENSQYSYHQAMFYKQTGRMRSLLDALIVDPRGQQMFDQWVKLQAIDVACDVVSRQMDLMVKALSTAKSVCHFTIVFLRSWSLDKSVVKPANTLATDVVKILHPALNTEKGLSKNKKKMSETVFGFVR
ncbi:hypothetical protein B0H10DRAFT_1959940 [Mycena sp. CBHHK59/15]|nr:hypothetical protein B0H10DRAFT_1959940 [Mycena sp. CBHHK59/15]